MYERRESCVFFERFITEQKIESIQGNVMENIDLRMLVRVLLMACLQSFLENGNFVKKYLAVLWVNVQHAHNSMCFLFL